MYRLTSRYLGYHLLFMDSRVIPMEFASIIIGLVVETLINFYASFFTQGRRPLTLISMA